MELTDRQVEALCRLAVEDKPSAFILAKVDQVSDRLMEAGDTADAAIARWALRMLASHPSQPSHPVGAPSQKGGDAAGTLVGG